MRLCPRWTFRFSLLDQQRSGKATINKSAQTLCQLPRGLPSRLPATGEHSSSPPRGQSTPGSRAREPLEASRHAPRSASRACSLSLLLCPRRPAQPPLPAGEVFISTPPVPSFPFATYWRHGDERGRTSGTLQQLLRVQLDVGSAVRRPPAQGAHAVQQLQGGGLQQGLLLEAQTARPSAPHRALPLRPQTQTRARAKTSLLGSRRDEGMSPTSRS